MKRTGLDIEFFKKKLEEELELVSKELKTVGRINPENPKDWEPTPPNIDVSKSDPSEVSELTDGYEENTAILKELEIRFNNLKSALKRIDEGKYGICEVSGGPIEKERLEANPAATTCLLHMN